MKRREFITLGGAAGWPLAARAHLCGDVGDLMRRLDGLMTNELAKV
jgi:hypothetical protein